MSEGPTYIPKSSGKSLIDALSAPLATNDFTELAKLLATGGFPNYGNLADTPSRFGGIVFDNEAAKKSEALNGEISELRKQFNSKVEELNRARSLGQKSAESYKSLKSSFDELVAKENLSFLLSKVNDAAKSKLLKSEAFRKQFLDDAVCDAFVMSVDIRRSTELMLKAKNPKEFAKFITTLCRELEKIVTANYGVVDKFTGDGLLAFFPDFFCGKDGAFYAMIAAQECHLAFERRYSECRSSFTTVLTDVGLGIGIDYGSTHLIQMAGGLTVVGAPVVYACRMSGANAGTTLLNQQGFERVSQDLSAYCFFRETELDLKHEGRTLAYEVTLNRKQYSPKTPDWLELDEPSKPKKS
ncbi:MAG TPA: hypothetical protein VGM64_06675 [Lacunisphaera sp.]|jgi:class 3 adenylate cyclase